MRPCPTNGARVKIISPAFFVQFALCRYCIQTPARHTPEFKYHQSLPIQVLCQTGLFVLDHSSHQLRPTTSAGFHRLNSSAHLPLKTCGHTHRTWPQLKIARPEQATARHAIWTPPLTPGTDSEHEWRHNSAPIPATRSAAELEDSWLLRKGAQVLFVRLWWRKSELF